MGFFSWETSDTKKSIRNRYNSKGATPCKMIDDRGREFIELHYDGYGVFGGMDFYALVDEMNGGDGDRMRGIDLCDLNHHDPAPDHIKTPRLVSIDCKTPWSDLEPSKNDPKQGYW